MFDTQVGGAWHYGPALDQEVDTAWEPGTSPWDYQMIKAGFNAYLLSQLNGGMVARYADPATGEYVEFQPMNLQWANDLQTQFIESPQAVNAVINDDVARWPDGYGAGRHFSWQTQTARFEKLLTIDSLASLPTANAVIRGGANPGLELQLIFRRSTGVGIWVNGTRWDTGGHADRSTSGLVEFRLLSDQTTVLWWFNLPRSWDSDGKEILGTFRFRRAGQTLNVYHRIPLAWIEDAARVWPIMVDTTVDAQVGTSTDDATYRASSSSFWTNLAQWQMGNNDGVMDSGARFPAAIPNAATIDVAYLSVYAPANDSDAVTVNIRYEDVDDAATFSTLANYTGRAWAGSISWALTSWTAGNWYNSSSIASHIQAIVNRAGWISGNNIVLKAVDNGSATLYRLPHSYDGSTTLAPKLHIEYTAGGSPGNLAAVLVTATAASPNATMAGKGNLATTLATVAAASPNAALTGKANLSASLTTATATSLNAAMSGKANMAAQEATATAATPNASIVGKAVMLAQVCTATARAIAASFPAIVEETAFYLLRWYAWGRR